jgi:hypothetical protein
MRGNSFFLNPANRPLLSRMPVSGHLPTRKSIIYSETLNFNLFWMGASGRNPFSRKFFSCNLSEFPQLNGNISIGFKIMLSAKRGESVV